MKETLVIMVRCADDIHGARHDISKFASGLPFSTADQARIDLTIKELASNIVKYGGGGFFTVSRLTELSGLKIVCHDSGPGIADVTLAMRPGYSTSDSFGDGLACVKEHMDSFNLISEVGHGTRVEVEKWVA